MIISKKISRILILMMILPIICFAGEITKTFEFFLKDINVKTVQGYDYLTLKDYSNFQDPGEPSLPYQSFKFVIPASAVLTDVEIIGSEDVWLEGKYLIFPCQNPVPVSSSNKHQFTAPDRLIYESNEPYPGELLKKLPVGNMNGFRIVQFHLFPVLYLPKEQKVKLYKSITVRISFRENEYPVISKGEKQIRNFGNVVKSIVENPEDVDECSPKVSESGFSLVNTNKPIQGVEIKGKTKISAIPKSQVLINDNKTMVKRVDEEFIKKPKREGIKNPTSEFVIHKPYLEASHPEIPEKTAQDAIDNAYISSPHPYQNSMDQSYYVYGPPENNWMCIHFSQINTESGWDKVYVYDNDGTLLNTYSGSYGGTWSAWGDGPIFRVRFTSDGSNTDYGFDVDYIQVGGVCSYENSQHPYAPNTNESIDMYGPAHDYLGMLCFKYDSIHTEEIYDKVYCYDKDNSTVLNTWSGSYDNEWSDWSSYNSSYTTKPHERSKLTSDGSVQYYGWLVNYYNYNRQHRVESAHNYPNNANQTYYVYGPQDQGSIQMRVHFSKLYTESSWDYVKIYDSNDNLINSYSGDQGTDLWSDWGDGNYIKVVLTSDNTVPKWGFKIDQYEWQAGGGGQANLTSYTPSGWDYPIVPSSVSGTHTVGPDLQGGATTYTDWAIINNGDATAKPLFYTYLYSDGVPLSGWYTDSLQPNHYIYVQDWVHTFSSGDHILKTFTDSTGVVSESNEGDNIYQHTFTWGGGSGEPNLTSYTPSGWDYPIVPSSVSGTHITGPDLQGGATTYIDWAIINNGDATAKPLFYTYLYSDGVPLSGWYTDSLQPNHYTYVEDWIHTFSAGDHTLKTFTDSTGVVSESNEGDNTYQHTFTWEGGVNLGWDHVIITNNAFIPNWSNLRSFIRSTYSLADTIITTEYIYSSYPGVDNQTKIRNFITDAVHNHSTQYILLGGDVDIVPYRKTFSGVVTGWDPWYDTIPCDLYYADIDGDWDGNSNGTYGEPNDNVDMYPDVWLGRAAVGSLTEITRFTNRFQDYYNTTSHQTKVLLAGFDLDENTHGETTMEQYSDLLPSGYIKKKVYDSHGGNHKDTFKVALNDGQNICFHIDHGNITYLGCGSSGGMSNSDMDGLTNQPEYSIFTSIACLIGAFDESDCITEHFMNASSGGGVLSMTNSRFGWYAPGQNPQTSYSPDYQKKFFDRLFAHSPARGYDFHLGKTDLVAIANSNNHYRWCMYALNLFGDPIQTIHIPYLSGIEENRSKFMHNLNDSTVSISLLSSNPFKDALILYINFPNPEQLKIQLFDITGREKCSKEIHYTPGKNVFNLNDIIKEELPCGIYYLNIKIGNKVKDVKKIIKIK